MTPGEPKPPHFGLAFAWLLDRGVPSPRIAAVFHTTPGNVRVAAFRARHAVDASTAEEALLAEVADVSIIRPGPDDVVRTPAGTLKLDRLRNEIEEVAQRHAVDYTFVEAVAELRTLIPFIGYAGDIRRIALAAQLHEHIAWFLVHSGRCASAVRESRLARELWRSAWHEIPSKDYAEGFVQAALIASNAHLLSRQPREAWNVLDIAGKAAESAGVDIGSEHHRQRGTVLFQLREDEKARLHFKRAAEAMDHFNEARIPEQLLMTGARQMNVLGTPNWENARQLVVSSRHAFGPDSLEASMAVHWAAAAGLSTDSKALMKEVLDMLVSVPSLSSRFGHQLTIRKLLSITPDLGLDLRLRKAWVRRTLYENAFRSR